MRRSRRQARALAGARVRADQARVPPRGGGGGGPRRAVADAERARWQVLARAWAESAESGECARPRPRPSAASRASNSCCVAARVAMAAPPPPGELSSRSAITSRSVPQSARRAGVAARDRRKAARCRARQLERGQADRCRAPAASLLPPLALGSGANAFARSTSPPGPHSRPARTATASRRPCMISVGHDGDGWGGASAAVSRMNAHGTRNEALRPPPPWSPLPPPPPPAGSSRAPAASHRARVASLYASRHRPGVVAARRASAAAAASGDRGDGREREVERGREQHESINARRVERGVARRGVSAERRADQPQPRAAAARGDRACVARVERAERARERHGPRARRRLAAGRGAGRRAASVSGASVEAEVEELEGHPVWRERRARRECPARRAPSPSAPLVPRARRAERATPSAPRRARWHGARRAEHAALSVPLRAAPSPCASRRASTPRRARARRAKPDGRARRARLQVQAPGAISSGAERRALDASSRAQPYARAEPRALGARRRVEVDAEPRANRAIAGFGVFLPPGWRCGLIVRFRACLRA